MGLELLVFLLFCAMFVFLVVLLIILDFSTQIRQRQQEEMQQELRDLYEAQQRYNRVRPNGLRAMNYVRDNRRQNRERRRQNETN